MAPHSVIRESLQHKKHEKEAKASGVMYDDCPLGKQNKVKTKQLCGEASPAPRQLRGGGGGRGELLLP